MAAIVLLFGHGLFNPSEQPAKAVVPGGCKLFLFARHKEELAGTRSRDLTYYISAYALQELRAEALDLGNARFIEEMKVDRHLRRVKVGGDMVHNYRLFPPHNLETNLKEGSEDALHVEFSDDAKGVTLQHIFDKYMGEGGTGPGTVFMWVACRAVEGLDWGVDAYQLPENVSIRNADDQPVTAYHRPADYGRKLG